MTPPRDAAPSTGLTLLDGLLAHERGDPAAEAPSLRPRLPYPFEHMPLALESAEPELRTAVDRPQAARAAPDERAGPAHSLAPAPLAPAAEARAPAARHAPPDSPPRVGPPIAASPPEASALRPIFSPRTTEPAAARVEPSAAPLVPSAGPGRPASVGSSPSPPPVEAPRPAPVAGRPPAPAPAIRAFHREPNRAEARVRPLAPLAAPQTPEPVIEISIGRIEVHAPAPGAKPPALRRATDPDTDRLSAYLDRRSRGARS
jgi:hypothetical protein